MFIKAIERVAQFTRPVHSILRTYAGKAIIPSAGTLFFVNEQGYAITCKHIAELLFSADAVNQQYQNFVLEKKQLPQDGRFKQLLKGLELKYKFTAESTIQLKNNFVDCVDTMSGFTYHLHPTLDLAIIKFNDFNKLHYSEFARFAKDDTQLQQGKFMCRLGFPFPEFTNYSYNAQTDDIAWTSTGVNVSPRFPMDGMVTRFLADQTHGVFGIELSTPGLRGQSGGPLFDDKGTVYGMQFSTKHLHLGFDLVDKEIMVNSSVKKVSDYSFIHLGQCIHMNAIKTFLQQHNVKYYEE
ncbi:MAG: serine protease [Chitinophagaceae bacterium]|nr:MAG: serine protease [Chitinophagaceae bacterium]